MLNAGDELTGHLAFKKTQGCLYSIGLVIIAGGFNRDASWFGSAESSGCCMGVLGLD
jgi:hypothetical protein